MKTSVEMKCVFIFVALVCTNLCFCQAGNTSGNQKVCATPGNPININVGRGGDASKGEKGDKGDAGMKGNKGDAGKGGPCRCSLQDPNKPSAHIEGANKGDVTYQVNKVIKDWTLSAPYSHLAGGMKYNGGKLTVPIPGRYYIYEQIYWRGYRGKPVRISILVNNKIIAMAHPPINSLRRDEFTISTGGVFYLKAGDVITVAATQYAGIAYMYTYHSFFGVKIHLIQPPYSHLPGYVRYNDGNLTVPIPGRYYIYEEIYWRGYRGKPGRIAILVNNKVAMAHPPRQSLRRDSSRVFYLAPCNVITVSATHHTWIAYMFTHHSFFGAFLIFVINTVF